MTDTMPPVTVLIVDDDAPFRHMAAELLATRGFEVVAYAGNVEQALAEYARTKPDAALVDVNLPGSDGFALSQALTEFAPRPRILLTSTDATAASPDAIAAAGAVGFVAKTELAVTDVTPYLRG
jgi:two-component system response regulator DesR